MRNMKTLGERERQPGASSALMVLPPVSAVFELGAIVALINFVDWLLPSYGLGEVGPSPYWLAVLLLSLQYGTVSGLMAAAIAILLTMLPGIPEQGVGENHFAFLLRIWVQPILWIAVAVLLGQFRMRQIAVKEELTRQVQELANQRQALADYSNNLRSRCEVLERHIAGQQRSPATALLLAQQALGLPDSDLGTALAKSVALSIHGGQASVYALEGLQLEKRADSGWFNNHSWANALPAGHPLYRAVVDRGESVSVLDTGGEAALSGEGVAAVPIRSAVNGAVVGMLKLEAASPTAIAPETVVALEVMAQVLSCRFAGAGLVAQSPTARPATADTQRTTSPGNLRSFFSQTMNWMPSKAKTPDLDNNDGERVASSTGGSRPRAVR